MSSLGFVVVIVSLPKGGMLFYKKVGLLLNHILFLYLTVRSGFCFFFMKWCLKGASQFCLYEYFYKETVVGRVLDKASKPKIPFVMPNATG